MHIKNEDLKIIADALEDTKLRPRKHWIIVAAMVAVIALLASTAARAEDPSFNCRYAKSADEVLICQDLDLAALDVQLADLFSQIRNQMFRRGRRQLDAEQAAWLRHRRACGRDGACIADAYRGRIDYLSDLCHGGRDRGDQRECNILE